MRYLLFLFGLPEMPTTHLLVFLGLALGCALTLGWVADAIMGDDGFGVILNALFAFGGAVLGVLAWRKLGYVWGTNPHLTTAVVAAIGATVSLVTSAALRRFI